MKDKNYWFLPDRKQGSVRQRYTFKLPSEFVTALKRRSDEETAAHGRKISQATMLMTLALRGDKQLNTYYKELTKGKKP